MGRITEITETLSISPHMCSTSPKCVKDVLLLLSELFFSENSSESFLRRSRSSRQFHRRLDTDIGVLTRASESDKLCPVIRQITSYFKSKT